MATTVINPQPKTRFMEVPSNISHHKELVQATPFERGTDFAMLQYAAWLSTQVSDSNSAMAAGFKLAGAHDYLATLKTMAEQPQALPRVLSGGLDHKA